MATVQQIFDMAIHLINEQDEHSGATRITETEDYAQRTISILNSVIPSLSQYSSGYQPGITGRPTATLLSPGKEGNPRFSQEIPLDDAISVSLLPYYLGAMLKIAEDTDMYDRLMSRYREAFVDLRSRIPACFEDIATPYGLF